MPGVRSGGPPGGWICGTPWGPGDPGCVYVADGGILERMLRRSARFGPPSSAMGASPRSPLHRGLRIGSMLRAAAPKRVEVATGSGAGGSDVRRPARAPTRQRALIAHLAVAPCSCSTMPKRPGRCRSRRRRRRPRGALAHLAALPELALAVSLHGAERLPAIGWRQTIALDPLAARRPARSSSTSPARPTAAIPCSLPWAGPPSRPRPSCRQAEGAPLTMSGGAGGRNVAGTGAAGGAICCTCRGLPGRDRPAPEPDVPRRAPPGALPPPCFSA
jgi:hypothetical protein